MTDHDDSTAEGTDEDKALRAVHALLSGGGWQPFDSGPSMRTYIRAWPDRGADNLVFTDASTAYAERVNADGDPVWQFTGTVVGAVAALRELPAPDAPDAPRTVQPRQDTADRDM